MFQDSVAALKAEVLKISNGEIKSFSKVIDDKNTPRSYLRNCLQAIWNIADIVEKKPKLHNPINLKAELSPWFDCLEPGTGALKISNEETLALGKAFLNFLNNVMKYVPVNKLQEVGTELNRRIQVYEASKRLIQNEVPPNQAQAQARVLQLLPPTPESSISLPSSESSSENQNHSRQPSIIDPAVLLQDSETRIKLLHEAQIALAGYKANLKKNPPVYPSCDDLIKYLEIVSPCEKAEFQSQYKELTGSGSKNTKNSVENFINKFKDTPLKQLKQKIKAKLKGIHIELQVGDLSLPLPEKVKNCLPAESLEHSEEANVTLFSLHEQYQAHLKIQALEKEKEAQHKRLEEHAHLMALRHQLQELEEALEQFNQLYQILYANVTNLRAKVPQPSLEEYTQAIPELERETAKLQLAFNSYQTKLASINPPAELIVPQPLQERRHKLQYNLGLMKNKKETVESILNTQLKGKMAQLQSEKDLAAAKVAEEQRRQKLREDYFGSDNDAFIIDGGKSRVYLDGRPCFFNKEDGKERNTYLLKMRSAADDFVKDPAKFNEFKAEVLKVNNDPKCFPSRRFFGGEEKSMRHLFKSLETDLKAFEPKI
jgi:hypothetical protein